MTLKSSEIVEREESVKLAGYQAMYGRTPDETEKRYGPQARQVTEQATTALARQFLAMYDAAERFPRNRKE